MKYLLNILFLLLFLNLYSQDGSYQKKLKEYIYKLESNTETKEKIIIYKDIIKFCTPEHLDSVIKYAGELIDIAEKTNDKGIKSFAFSHLGECYLNSENFAEANNYFINAQNLYKQLNDTDKTAYTSYKLGLINHYLNHYDKALSFYQKSVELYEKIGKKYEVAISYHDIGTLYNDLQKYSLAQYYYDKALEIYKTENKQEKIAAIYQNIGVLHYNWGNFNKSLDYYNKSLSLYENLKDKENVAISLSNIGLVYEENHYYNKALENYQKALLIFEEIDSKQMLIYIFYNLGSIYSNLGEYSKSIEYFEKGAALSSEISKKDYISYNYEALSGVYEYLGKYNKALKYYKDYVRVKDSIFNEEKYNQIRLLEDDFQNKEHQKEIEMLKLDQELKESKLKKKEAQNMVLIFSTVSGFIIVILLFLFNRYQRKISFKLYNEIEERKKAENKLHIIKEELEIRIQERTSDIEKYNKKLLHEVEQHKKTLKDLEIAKNRAEEADKLKSNFLANMSHELRTPMNAITGFAQMMLHDNISNTKRREYVNLIREGCNSLTNLIDDIVDFANIESGEVKIDKREFNPHPTLEFLYDHYTNELVKRHKEHLNLTYENENIENNLVIYTDPSRLKQILSIFIDNAIKFTENGNVQFGFIRTGHNKIQFYVKDSGIGIDKKYSHLIFERFRQIDESITKKYGGTGIGLSVAKNLAKMLNGEIWFESVPNKGTTFYFEMASNSEEEKIKYVQPNQFNWGNKVILIAEDKKINYEILKESLEPTSAKLVWVKNGKDAIDYVRSGNKIDLILMDIQMPEMDGYETTRQIKKIKNIPIIAQTAYALPLDSYKCFDAGCDDYIAKPISLDKFLHILDKYLS